MTAEQYYSMHQKAFRTAFDFLNKHFPPGQDPEWWTQTVKDCDEASISQGENKLVIGLLGGIIDYLEDEYKRRINDGSTET